MVKHTHGHTCTSPHCWTCALALTFLELLPDPEAAQGHQTNAPLQGVLCSSEWTSAGQPLGLYLYHCGLTLYCFLLLSLPSRLQVEMTFVTSGRFFITRFPRNIAESHRRWVTLTTLSPMMTTETHGKVEKRPMLLKEDQSELSWIGQPSLGLLLNLTRSPPVRDLYKVGGLVQVCF